MTGRPFPIIKIVDWVGLSSTYWGVNVVEEVSVRVRAVKIGGFGRVDHTAASNGEERIDAVSFCKVRCFTKTHIGRLNAHLRVGR